MKTEGHIGHLTTVTDVVTLYIHKDSNALQISTNAKFATNMVTFPVYVTKRRPRCITRAVAEILKHTNFMQVPCMHSYFRKPSSGESFCLQLQAQSNHVEGKQIPNPLHLIMNLAYHLKLHHSRNMYLQTWLDTCTNVNIMPASVYQLVFKDLEIKKIKLCKMPISTYTADTVKIIGSCIFHVIHPDMKKLVPVTFYIANNDGRVLLWCKTTVALQLIQAQSKLDYLPPWTSLITSTIDHPKKTKLTSLKVHQSKQEVSDQKQKPPSKASMSTITSKEQILSKYLDVFEGISRFPSFPYHIQVNLNVMPKQTPCRPVPIHLKEAFKKEIDEMLQASVIKTSERRHSVHQQFRTCWR